MKTIIFLLVAVLNTEAQSLVTNYYTASTNWSQPNVWQAVQRYTNSTDIIAICNQLGAMTNASGAKIWNPTYLTNQNFTAKIGVYDVGQVLPFELDIWAVQGVQIQ